MRRAALSNVDTLLDRDTLKEVCIESQERWLGCLMLPVTLLFFSFYSMAASMHQDVSNSHLLEAPIRAKLMPPLEEHEDPTPDMLQGVLTVPEVYHYLENTYIPMFFKQSNAQGQALPQDEWSKIYEYNRVKGLVIMELERSPKVPCANDVTNHMDCYPKDQSTTGAYGLPLADLPGGWNYYMNASDGSTPLLRCENEGFDAAGCPQDGRRLGGMLRDDMASMMPKPMGGDKRYQFAFDPMDSYDRVKARFQYLKDRGWLDPQSKTLTLRAFILNYQMEVPRLQTVTTTFFFSRGGGIFSTLTFIGFGLTTFKNTMNIVFDVLFVVTLIVSTGMIIRELCKDVLARNPWAQLSFVNLVTWASMAAGWVSVAIILISTTWRQSVVDSLERYIASPTQANAFDFADTADAIGVNMQTLRIFIAGSHILFMTRCFTSLKWQPRLEVVTRTISVMASDLLHFLIVLIPTFVAFAIAGQMIFGRRLQTFSTIQAALATCFKISMESEFRWQELSAQDYMTTASWVFPFMTLVVVLMINMVLAIIMDIYQEVRREAGSTMTITRNLQYIYSYVRFRGTWISTQELVSVIDNMPQTVSVLELRQAFPSMPDYQQSYLVKECNNKEKKITRVGVDASVTEQMVAAIHISLEEILKDVSELKNRGWMGMGFEISDSSERETIKDIMTSIATQQQWMSMTQKSMDILQARIDGTFKEEKEEAASDPPKGGGVLKATE
uniref:Polycystin cation channel PKD1/PKD2 domain-containing protein n=1 Tax=Zooxanthella nutricula TaxID=1333877 RepID=A0A7S2VKX4_9DINO